MEKVVLFKLLNMHITYQKIYSVQCQSDWNYTSPLSTFTNASIRENPSSCRVFAISSIWRLHLSRASLLIHRGSNEEYYQRCSERYETLRIKEEMDVLVSCVSSRWDYQDNDKFIEFFLSSNINKMSWSTPNYL